jgi:uncharacterized LabA/DUF88 family protein
MPANDIVKIKYFTARVSPKMNPGGPARQETFLRALRTLPNLEIHLGLFATHNVWRPLALPKCSHPRKDHQLFSKDRINVQVVDTKEKGSDVNLAIHLLNDAWLGNYDVAAIISNDSDLVLAIQIVRGHLKKGVGIINPHNKLATELAKEADFKHQIRAVHLAAAQFPDAISGTTITKPAEW